MQTPHTFCSVTSKFSQAETEFMWCIQSTYSFPVARGIFFGIDFSCFPSQLADTKPFMLPSRTLHWHGWGHSADKQKQTSIKLVIWIIFVFNRSLLFKDFINRKLLNQIDDDTLESKPSVQRYSLASSETKIWCHPLKWQANF